VKDTISSSVGNCRSITKAYEGSSYYNWRTIARSTKPHLNSIPFSLNSQSTQTSFEEEILVLLTQFISSNLAQLQCFYLPRKKAHCARTLPQVKKKPSTKANSKKGESAQSTRIPIKKGGNDPS